MECTEREGALERRGGGVAVDGGDRERVLADAFVVEPRATAEHTVRVHCEGTRVRRSVRRVRRQRTTRDQREVHSPVHRPHVRVVHAYLRTPVLRVINNTMCEFN